MKSKVISIRVPEELWNKAMKLPVEDKKFAVEKALELATIIAERNEKKQKAIETLRTCVEIIRAMTTNINDLLKEAYYLDNRYHEYVGLEGYMYEDEYEITLKIGNKTRIMVKNYMGKETGYAEGYIPELKEIITMFVNCIKQAKERLG